jgi:hypothetical protein
MVDALVKPFSTAVYNPFLAVFAIDATLEYYSLNPHIMENNLPGDDLRNFLNGRNLPEQLKKWLNERDLLPFLKISPKTLSNWRSKRRITFTKFVGVLLYDGYEIAEQLDKGLRKRKG